MHAMETVTDVPRASRRVDGCPEVLLAEDDRELRLLLAMALGKAGFRVTTAESGADLLTCLWERAAQNDTFDLIISDNLMPAFTGLEVLEGLRNECEPQIADTPVIIITAFGDPELHEEAESLGAVVFNKPFDVDDLCTYALELLRPRLAEPTLQ